MSINKKSVVLIVDDTIANIQILNDLLKVDYTIKVATNGQQALNLAVQEPRPDIILLDIMMPGMDGYEVCEKLKSNPITKSIAVVFITAMTGEDDEAKGLDLGAVDFITKPFQPRLVRARVANHITLKKYSDNLEGLVQERTRELFLSRSVTVECLATVVETRDNETGGHVRRTQNGVEILAKKMRELFPEKWNNDDETIELYRTCAPLHDVGKVGIPDRILLKPGKLDAEEFEIMKKHTTLGYQAMIWAEKRMGQANSFLSLGAVVALTHHERWDGTGYPKGLVGEEIPQIGRLMAMADVYDALTSKRVYKPPMPHETAMQIILDSCGTHFDPDIVTALVECQEDFETLRREIPDDHEGSSEHKLNLFAEV